MVLRSALVALLAFSFSVWSADPSALERAQKFAQKNQKVQALRILEQNYNLSSRELPVKVAVLAANLAIELKNWRKAERVADAALSAGWPEFRGKKPDYLPLVKMSAEAKSEILTGGDDLATSERKKLKSEIKTYSEVMLANNYENDTAQGLLSRSQKEAVVKKDEYKIGASLSVAYSTWEDRPTFDYKLKAKAVMFTPCFGFNVNYIGDTYIMSGGACYAQGHADIQFNDGKLDNLGTISMINGSGSVLMRVSEGGSAYGIEGNWMNATLKGKAAGDREVSANNQDFAFLAVGRFQVWSVDLKFKGGTVVTKPSAIWSFEMAIPIF